MGTEAHVSYFGETGEIVLSTCKAGSAMSVNKRVIVKRLQQKPVSGTGQENDALLCSAVSREQDGWTRGQCELMAAGRVHSENQPQVLGYGGDPPPRLTHS